ncbi:MAG: hypothetical protein J6W24_05985 [Prevotella sp.]|nr:hypothetical protein [Prevotella sp.]
MTTNTGIGQTLLDIAVVTAGTMEAAMALAIANGLPLTADLTNGQELECVEVKRRDIRQMFITQRTQPATALATIEGEEDIILGGIGYMAVGIDFIVS